METTAIETHPWEPFVPDGAKVLIMGTFPPAAVRWSMPFFYPNRINDFWRIMGLIFFGDRDRFVDNDLRSFRLDDIRHFLYEKKIALGDTGYQVRRLKGNASDKFLEIVTPIDLTRLLDRMPHCRTVATTGEKAAGVVAEITGTHLPKMGHMVSTVLADGRELTITRMPSTSRAYPMKLERKADYYRLLFESCGIL